MVEAPYESDRRTPDNQTCNEGSKTERQIARYTGWLTVCTALLSAFTFILAIATGGLWYYAYKQSEDMKEVVASAKDSARAAKDAVGLDRAWIGAPKIEDVRAKDGSVSFMYVIQNSGKRPVKSLFIVADIKSDLNYNSGTLIKQMDAAAEEGRLALNGKDTPSSRHAIVPGGNFKIGSVGEIRTNLSASAASDATLKTNIVGAITYGFEENNLLKLHFTKFVVDVTVDNGKVIVSEPWVFDAD
ncbi:hypothetical protein [uncultured Methylobacterium sp.]|uniref:hypothetical protein n=1 Tax=uncultured Methylobacterium sp. TaxID=157278 RepID=UPI0035CA9304